MKFYNLIIALTLMLGLNSCWIGDQDDPEILYDPTVIQIMCQTPELGTFCEMAYLTSLLTGPCIGCNGSTAMTPSAAWKLQFSGRTIVEGKACPTQVETVFAPTNDAFATFMEEFPHWESIYDIPQDTVDLIVRHHIFLDSKLINQLGEDSECMAEELIGGSAGYDMWTGRWIFLANSTAFIAASENSGRQTTTPILSPDFSTTDGVVYVIHDVLAPF